jgi:hypothetical protein
LFALTLKFKLLSLYSAGPVLSTDFHFMRFGLLCQYLCSHSLTHALRLDAIVLLLLLLKLTRAVLWISGGKGDHFQ